MYGQTTSGKTYTMLGNHENPGILPCSLRDIFKFNEESIRLNKIISSKIYCSYIEIYNENIHDLLTNSSNLKLVEDAKFGVVVNGLKKVIISNFEDGINLKDFGEENRKYRETLINEYSSRSHSIFQIMIESVLDETMIHSDDVNYGNFDGKINKSNTNPHTNTRYIRKSYLNLVDLAGSERIHEHENKSDATIETGHINKSLFVLGNVISKLSSQEKQMNKSYIPYRDSKLTRLLSQSLGGNALTSIICTISPAAINYYQTLSTLRFATRAKTVKLKAEAMIDVDFDQKNEIEFYRREINRLKEEIQKKEKGVNKYVSAEEFQEMVISNKKLLEDLEYYKIMYFKEKDKNQENSKIYHKNEEMEMENKANPLGSNANINNNTNFTPSLSYLSNSNEENLNESYEILHNLNHISSPTNNNKSNFKDKLNEYLVKKQENPSSSPKSTMSYKNINTYNTYNTYNTQNSNNTNSSYTTNPLLNITKIFNSIKLSFIPNTKLSIENNIITLKKTYEVHLNSLEKLFENEKINIENFFRNKIKKTLIDFSNDNKNQGNLPIIGITNEHSIALNQLRICFDEKIKSSEKEFYSFLKSVSSYGLK